MENNKPQINPVSKACLYLGAGLGIMIAGNAAVHKGIEYSVRNDAQISAEDKESKILRVKESHYNSTVPLALGIGGAGLVGGMAQLVSNYRDRRKRE